MQMPEHDTLLEEAFRLLGRTIARVDPGRLEAWVELGLTMTQLRVLFILRGEDGASARALAERLNVTPSTLTRIVDRLVGQGLVRRTVDEEDRRLVRHCLTDAGASTVALTLGSIDARPVPDLDVVRDAWVAELNTLGRLDP